MAKDFMSATTEVEGIVEKIQKDVRKIGDDIADAASTRAKSGKTGALKNDIMNMIKDLPTEYQISALLEAVTTLAGANGTGNTTGTTASSKRFGSAW